jgi:hypothetical protein
MEPGLDTETRFEAALLVAGSIEEGFLFLVDIFTLSILKLYIYIHRIKQDVFFF